MSATKLLTCDEKEIIIKMIRAFRKCMALQVKHFDTSDKIDWVYMHDIIDVSLPIRTLPILKELQESVERLETRECPYSAQPIEPR